MIDNSHIRNFNSISLEETNSVKLMNRVDSKYVLSYKALNYILEEIKDDYSVLEINDKRLMPYVSLYYDTFENSMYLAHHNGKLNRYKIRYRKYLTSNQSFLEVKYKLKGIRTIKKRIEVEDIEHNISDLSAKFLKQTCPFLPETLEPKIYTDFSRITLVNRNFSERATIDLKLLFRHNNSTKFQLNNSAIIETKRDGNKVPSVLKNVLSKYGVQPSGMSKYCLGRAISEDSIKSNQFKEKILTLKKIENDKYYYRNITPA